MHHNLSQAPRPNMACSNENTTTFTAGSSHVVLVSVFSRLNCPDKATSLLCLDHIGLWVKTLVPLMNILKMTKSGTIAGIFTYPWLLVYLVMIYSNIPFIWAAAAAARKASCVGKNPPGSSSDCGHRYGDSYQNRWWVIDHPWLIGDKWYIGNAKPYTMINYWP